MLILLLLACQEPFARDRHDLVGDRIAAVEVRVEGEQVRPRLAIVAAGRAWADALPPLGWSFVPEGDDAAAWTVPAGEAGEGPAPVLELGEDRRLVLVVGWPSGERRHVIDLPAPLPAVGPIALAVAEPPAEPDLALEARLDWPSTPADFVPADGVALLTAPTEGSVRWMATAGDFLELGPARAHWWPGAIARDGEVLEAVEPGVPGPVTVIAAAVEGGVGFTAAEVHVEPPPTGLFTPSGRWLPTDVAVAPGRVQGVLEADEASPCGLRLAVLAPVDASVDPGTASLCALPHTGPFDPDWLLDGTCLRGEVLGATVVVEAR